MGQSGHFYSHVDLVWSLQNIGTDCILGRAPRTKETLPDLREWCWVTRHPRVFRGLTGCQPTPEKWGVTILFFISSKKYFLRSYSPKLNVDVTI